MAVKQYVRPEHERLRLVNKGLTTADLERRLLALSDTECGAIRSCVPRGRVKSGAADEWRVAQAVLQ